MPKALRFAVISPLIFALICGSFIALNPLAFATTYTITSMAQSGAGSLSAAITLANANPGLDLIECDASMGGTTEYTVALPSITEDLIIDCSDSGTQVVLHNNSGGVLAAIVYSGGGNHEIRGLDFDGFNSGIRVNSTVTGSVLIGGTGVGEDILIENSLDFNIGIDDSNVTVQNTTLLASEGENMRISSGSGIVIGGTTSEKRNYINAAAGTGINIQAGVTGVTIEGNYIGVAANGTTGDGNAGAGVLIEAGASGVMIGGATSASRNVISDNLTAVNTQTDGGVTVRNNYIGLTAAGTAALGNNARAIAILGSNNTIQENVISGNAGAGINLSSADQVIDGNSIISNVIGLSANQSAVIANAGHGVSFTGAVNAITDTLIQGNVISGNNSTGITIANTIHSGTQIWGNYIGTNSSLAANLGNFDMGLDIHGLNTDMDASSDVSKRNIIVDNGGSAALNLEEAVGTVVKNNYIGWDGTSQNPNTGPVVQIKVDAAENVIGGVTANAGNTFCAPDSPNEYVVVASTAGDYNTVRGNSTPCSVELVSDPFISVTDPANESLDVAPTFTSASITEVAGTGACANCAVDIYGYDFYDGVDYITTLTANGSGNWSGSATLTDYSKAIAAFTNASGSTSKSSLGYGLSGASTTFNVINTNNSGAGSLRQAMLNAETVPGNDIILCDSGLSGTISLLTALTALNESVSIDCSDAASLVTVDSAGPGTAFAMSAGTGYVIKGFTLTDFVSGVSVADGVSDVTIGGSGTRENIVISGATNASISISGDDVSIQATEIASGGSHGIDIASTASDITIGGSVSAAEAVNIHDIGTGGIGIRISGASTVIIQNTTVKDASVQGILVQSSASGITIGGEGTFQRNIIVSNTQEGIKVSSSSNVSIINNYIGLESDGTTANGNGDDGIEIGASCTTCTVGGSTNASRNVISSNTAVGVNVLSAETTIRNNYIGTNAAGTAARANSQEGVYVRASTVMVRDNLISGNTFTGVKINENGSAISGITVLDNIIGLTANGSSALGNGNGGILIGESSSFATTGTTIQDNLVSSNTGHGIAIEDSIHTGTKIWGNYIGVDITGLIDRGNTQNGVRLEGGSTDMDASLDSSKRNIIAGNGSSCIGVQSNSNVIKGNYCGYGSDGTTEILNDSIAISLDGTSENNTIGGILAGEENRLCTTTVMNVYFLLNSSAGNGNEIRGNDIPCDNFRVPIVGFGNLVAEMITRPLGGSANNGYVQPTFSETSPSAVSGTAACDECLVDIYGGDATRSAMYLGSGTALNDDDGDGNEEAIWYFPVDLSSYTTVIAAYTDADGNTSTSTAPLAITALRDFDGDGILSSTEIVAGKSDSDATDNDTVLEQARTLFLASDATADGIPYAADLSNNEATNGGGTELLTNVIEAFMDEYEEGFQDPTSVGLSAYASPGNPTRAELQAVVDAVNPGFTVTESSGSTTVAEAAGTDTFTVVLDSAPASNVVFNITSGDTGAATVSAATLTFTTLNWDDAQTITVTGVNDDDTSDESVTITIAVNDAGSDNNFDDLANETVTAAVTDDDEPDDDEPEAENDNGGGSGGGRGSSTFEIGESDGGDSEDSGDLDPQFTYLSIQIDVPEILATLYDSELETSVLGDEWTPEMQKTLGYPEGAFDVTLDSDLDGLLDTAEQLLGTNPWDNDSDDDGMADGLEVLTGTDPSNAAEFRADALDIAVDCGEEMNPFEDTSGHFAEKSICLLVMQGILVGYPDGSFAPNKEVSRAEFVKMVLMISGLEIEAEESFAFTDSDAEAWEYPYVTSAHKHGIISGYEDGSFKPAQSITRAEAVTIIVRTFQSGVVLDLSNPYIDFSLGDWFAPFVISASYEGVVVGKSKQIFDPAAPLTRGEAAALIRRVQYAYSK